VKVTELVAFSNHSLHTTDRCVLVHGKVLEFKPEYIVLNDSFKVSHKLDDL